jgi:hypothetical protein
MYPPFDNFAMVGADSPASVFKSLLLCPRRANKSNNLKYLIIVVSLPLNSFPARHFLPSQPFQKVTQYICPFENKNAYKANLAAQDWSLKYDF